MIESTPKCQTMFSRTSGSSELSKTFGQTFPNCGTYFFKHVSDGEDDLEGIEPLKIEELDSDQNCNILPPTLPDVVDCEEVRNYFCSGKEINRN